MAVESEEKPIEFGFNEHFEYRSGTMDNGIIDGRNSRSRTDTPGVFSVSLSIDYKCITLRQAFCVS